MESEFLLVWVPTAQLHLAAPGVALSFVKREKQCWGEELQQGTGTHAAGTAQNKAQSEATGGALSLDLAIPVFPVSRGLGRASYPP